MRSPPVRRTRLPCYRSAGHRLFSLRVMSRGRGWSNVFGWVSNFVWCLVLLSSTTSCTVRIPRSLWNISLVTYHGALTNARNIAKILTLTSLLYLKLQTLNTWLTTHNQCKCFIQCIAQNTQTHPPPTPQPMIVHYFSITSAIIVYIDMDMSNARVVRTASLTS
jgi:hypothetical protein